MRWILLALILGGCAHREPYYFGDNQVGPSQSYTAGDYDSNGRFLGPHKELRDRFRRPGRPFDHWPM